VLAGARFDKVDLYAFPLVQADLVLVDVTENVSFVSPAVHIERVKVSHERVVSSWTWCILWTQVNPLVLQSFELCQVVEVDPAFTGVASEEVDTVFE